MPSDLSRTVLSNLGTACWQGGLLILAVWLVCRVFRNLSPAVRQTLWWMACLKLVITALWIRPLVLTVLPAAKQIAPNLTTGSAMTAPAGKAGIGAGHGSSGFPWADFLVAVWLLGTLIVIAFALKEAIAARRIARYILPIDDTLLGEELRGLAAEIGITRVPKLARSTKVSAPCVLGHWRPTVIVPDDFDQTLTPEERRMALAHELAHVRRADLWLAVVPACAYALFYFFPPVWLACREWATDREATCDFDALAATGSKPKAYGEMLLKIARKDHRRLIPGLGATRQFHTLKRRIASMVAGPSPVRPRAVSTALLALTAIVIVPVTLASPKPKNETLSNGDFEQGSDGPTGWTAVNPDPGFDLQWDASVAHSGTRSVRITRSTKRYWPIAKWTHDVPFDGKATSLEFGAWIKADHAGKAVLDAQFEGPNGFWRHQWVAYIGEQALGQEPATHDWAPYSGVVRIPAGTTKIKVSLQDYGPGTVWMDDAFIQFMSSPTTPVAR